ncbi:MAG: hypothetical protein WD066_01190 [Planctomycetaceae bacterium]
MRVGRFIILLGLWLLPACWGCAHHEHRNEWSGAVPGNPVFVPGGNHEMVWERTVDVLHTYFEIGRENKLDGVIETRSKTGSSVIEPWHHETVGCENRWESTLQSIRRRAIVTITPVEGGFFIGVEAYKELEDLVGVAALTAGGATFQDFNPLRRDLDLVVGQSTPSGWIPQGRDVALEQKMLDSIRAEFLR